MKHHIRISSKNFWHILEIFHPVQVGNAVYCEVSCVNVRSAQWQRHPGVLGYKRPITMTLSGFFLSVLGYLGIQAHLKCLPPPSSHSLCWAG